METIIVDDFLQQTTGQGTPWTNSQQTALSALELQIWLWCTMIFQFQRSWSVVAVSAATNEISAVKSII